MSSGAVAIKTMELGELNLEVELEDENQECVHHWGHPCAFIILKPFPQNHLFTILRSFECDHLQWENRAHRRRFDNARARRLYLATLPVSHICSVDTSNGLGSIVKVKMYMSKFHDPLIWSEAFKCAPRGCWIVVMAHPFTGFIKLFIPWFSGLGKKVGQVVFFFSECVSNSLW